MPFTIPNEADAGFADQAEPDSRDWTGILTPALTGTAVITGGTVTAQGTPDMTVAVAAGVVLIAAKAVNVTAGNVTITTANATNPRFDLICVDAAGAKSAVAGTASSNPVFPDPAGKVVLAAVYVPANDTAINSNQITDKRVLVSRSLPGVYDVTDYGAVPDDYYTDAKALTGQGTVTATAATDLLTKTSHGFAANDVVTFTTTTTLPGGLAVNTKYFVLATGLTANDFKVSTTSGGTAVDITDTGTGTHTVVPALTSATAGFAAADVGKVILVEKAFTRYRPHTSTIATVLDSTTVTLTNTVVRSETTTKIYISRAGTQQAAFDAAVLAAYNNGGGTVLVPGRSYMVDSVVLKNLVQIKGAATKATMLHQTPTTRKPVVTNDTANNAMWCAVRDMTIDGANQRQSHGTTTLGAAYTAGDATITLTAGGGALVPPAGALLIGTNRLRYNSVSGDVLSGVIGGREDTTDANASIGATVTFYWNHGIYFVPNPYSGTQTITYSETGDPHHLIEHVYIRSCKADGVSMWGQSEIRIRDVYVYSCDEVGIRPAFDTWMSDCTADGNGRMGYYSQAVSGQASNIKAFTNGGVDATKGHGFLIEGPVTLEEGCYAYSGVNAQDNKGAGIYLRTVQRVALQGTASSNSVSGVGSFPGLLIDGCTNGLINVVTTERNNTGNNQTNALKILSTSVQCEGNQITVAWDGTAGATVGAALATGSDLAALGVNQVNILSTHVNGATGRTGFWVTASKIADTTRTSNATLANDPDLLFTMLASRNYRIRGRIFFDTTAAADFKYGFTGPASPTLVRMKRSHTVAGGTPAELAIDVANVTTVSLAGTGTTGGYIEFDVIWKNGTTAGVWAFQWAQDTLTAANTTVLAGSYIDYALA